MDNSIPRQCPLCKGTEVTRVKTIKDYSVSGETFSLWDCASCGLRFTMPIPPPDRIGVYYQSEGYISHSDTREGLINKIYHIARDFMLGISVAWYLWPLLRGGFWILAVGQDIFCTI